MERRRFLGSAAAAASLPYVADQGAPRASIDVDEDLGTSTARFDEHDTTADVELWGGLDSDASLRVVGEWLDDEPSHVHLAVRTDAATITATVSPNEAREIAAELLEAADHAEAPTKQ